MKPNIIIILMDTLRKDAFDKWLKEYNGKYKSIVENSFIFDNARSPSSWTLPSHISLFTGLYPSEHGIHELYDNYRVPDVIKMSGEYKGKLLMDLAKENGYYASGFSANPVLSYSGVPDHFNNFVNIQSKFVERVEKFEPGAFLSKEDMDKYTRIESRVKAAQFLIKKHPLKATLYISGILLNKYKDPTYKGYKEILKSFIDSTHFISPQFVFFNFMEMHDPYIKHVGDVNTKIEYTFGYKKLNNSKLKKMKEIYFAQASKITSIFDAIISKLIDEKQLDNSIIIITSDHGQGFNENGYVGHGIYNYDEISRIPLLIHVPENLIKQKTYDKYINTGMVNLFDFIKDIIVNDNVSLEKLKSDIVLCESYGIANNIRLSPKYENRQDFNEIKKKIDIPRKTLFKGNIKLTLNADGTVEEFNGNRDDYRELIDYLSIFNVDKCFKIPENEEAIQKYNNKNINEMSRL